jgi:hypothetical protein
MKKIVGAFLALISGVALSATLNPVQLLNPAGSTAGQAVVSTGPSTAPGWSNVTASGLVAQAANTVVANVTASTASPTAVPIPSCSTSSSALGYTSNTGLTCNTSINASSLGGTAAASYALLASPTFTGTPTAPTATAGTNTTQLATTAFAQNAVTGGGNAASFTTIAASGLISPTSAIGIKGTTTNDDAQAGSIGEAPIPSNLTGVSLTSGSASNLSSVSLTAGDYEAAGTCVFTAAASTVPTTIECGIGTTSATMPGVLTGNTSQLQATFSSASNNAMPTPVQRIKLATTTTLYLVGISVFSTSTMSGAGFLYVRRAR